MQRGSHPLRSAELVAVVGMLALLLAACGGASTSSRQAPKDQQILKSLELGPSAGDLATLDPALITFAADYDHAQQIFPGLITLDNDLTVQDWAAERHEVSSDGLTYTFHLRPGMKWSDGAPIDATTFAYSINRALDPCTGSSVASYLYNIKGAAAFNSGACADGATASTDTLIGASIVVADPLTLTLTLGAPAAYFLGALSTPTSWAVPKQLIDQYHDKWTDHLADNSGFGGNLFKLTKWDHAGHLDLTVNDNFWGQKPIIQQIHYTLYSDPGTAWADYQIGQGDVGAVFAQVLDAAKTLRGSTLHQTPLLAVGYLQFNWTVAPFDDARVRNAFSLAIDRKAIAHSVLKDSVQPSIHMLIQGLPGYNADLKNAAGDKGDAALVANTAKAKELMTAYAADTCGGDLSACAPIVFTIAGNSPTTPTPLSQALQAQWQTAFPGLQITIASMDFVALNKARNLMLTLGGWGADYPDPQDFTTVLWNKNSPYNRGSVDVPAADALAARADVSTDATRRLALYQQAEQLWVNQGAFAVMFQPLQSYIVRDRVVNFRYNSSGVTANAMWQQVYIKA